MLPELSVAKSNMTKEPKPQGIPIAGANSKIDHNWIPVATATTPGLIKPSSKFTISEDGTLDGGGGGTSSNVVVFGYPIVTLPAEAGHNVAFTITMATPLVILPGATVVSYHVAVNGAAATTVPATNGSGSHTLTSTSPAGSTDTIVVTATDSVGNTSLKTINTIKIVEVAVAKPVITSPTNNSEVGTTNITIVTGAFKTIGPTQNHVSTKCAITTESGHPDTAADVLHAFQVTSGNLLIGVANTYTATKNAKLGLWASHVGSLTGASPWSDHIVVTAANTVTPGGRVIYRHSSGMGSVIEFNDGQLRRVLVLDSMYRDKQKWGTYGTDMPQLTNYQTTNTRGDWYLNTSGTSNTNAATVMTDAVINSLWVNSIDNKTAKQNCDIWMTKQGSSDSQGISGVPAVAYARTKLVNGIGCDVPNIQTLMRIFLDANYIDALDPTAAANPTKALGSMNSGGYWNSMGTSVAWASSEYSSNYVRYVGSNGYCSYATKNGGYFVVPVQEL